jgi:hypothetical protein
MDKGFGFLLDRAPAILSWWRKHDQNVVAELDRFVRGPFMTTYDRLANSLSDALGQRHSEAGRDEGLWKEIDSIVSVSVHLPSLQIKDDMLSVLSAKNRHKNAIETKLLFLSMYAMYYRMLACAGIYFPLIGNHEQISALQNDAHRLSEIAGVYFQGQGFEDLREDINKIEKRGF